MDRSDEINTKTARLVEMLHQQKLGGVLLGSQPNFSWLTAGGSNGVDLSREPGAGALFVRSDGKCFVLANRIEMPRLLSEELSDQIFEPIEFAWEDEKASPTFLASHAAALMETNSALGSDIGLGANVLTIEAPVARCRYQLTSDEQERLRQLGNEAGEIVGNFVKELVPGQTEREVARQVGAALGKSNIRAVVNLVAADERLQKYRHPIPTERRWEKVLMIVVCAQRGGLIASFSRIICHGTLPDELEKRTRATAAVNAQILSATRPGVQGAELYRHAARAYEQQGYEGEEHLHHQGGATGYRTRDWVAHPACTEEVQSNQAFAWNPSISGTKVEETVIASDDSVEVVTGSPGWPQISVMIEGREYLSPDVLCV